MNRLASVALVGTVAMLASVAAFAGFRVARPTTRERSLASDAERTNPALAAIGKRAFFDTSLSEPPGTSCASCHNPALGYAGNHGGALGVALGSRPGHFAKRNTPSVLYLTLIHRFHFHWEEDAPLPDAVGGFFWDGRIDSLAELTRQPLLNADEMGNLDVAMLAKKIAASDFAGDLRTQLGSIDDDEAAVGALGKAVAAFLTSDAMQPFTSRYDDVIRGKATFTPEEARGLTLFKDPAKGNCAFCHKMNDSVPAPERSPFSDYGFETVGIPRNTRLPATRNAAYFDLGLCEHDDALGQTSDERFCGAFRTPSLRNVAVRPAFMHNGAFTSLRDVVAFYATRATDPGRWYGTRATPEARYDDLPRAYQQNVNDLVAPYDHAEGAAPALDDGEIDAIVSFLGTLTDATHR